jgi:hypothetical protein
MVSRAADGIAEALIGGSADSRFQSATDCAVRSPGAIEQEIERQSLQKLGLFGLVKNVKSGRDIGLKWKLVQQLGAECMDRLYLEAAGGFQGAREQTPRQAAAGCAGLDAAGVADRRVECGIVERRPFGECVEDALGHIGGRGFGEGDAQNFFGRDTLQ